MDVEQRLEEWVAADPGLSRLKEDQVVVREAFVQSLADNTHRVASAQPVSLGTLCAPRCIVPSTYRRFPPSAEPPEGCGREPRADFSRGQQKGQHTFVASP